MQNKLQAMADLVGSKFILLVVGTEYYWYNRETFLPTDPPKNAITHDTYLTKIEDIVNRTYQVLDIMRGKIPTTYEMAWILGYGFIIRLYLHKIGCIEQWRELVNWNKYLETIKQAIGYFGLNKGDLNEVPIRNINEDLLRELVDHLDEFPPESPIIGKVFLDTITKVLISSRERGQFVAPEKVRELVRIVAKSMDISNGEVIDLTTGIGAMLNDISGIIEADKFIGIDLNQEVAMLAQITMNLSQRNNVEIIAQDATLFDSRESAFKLVICEPPLGQIVLNKKEDYSSFVVTQGGKRLKLELAELFIEKSIKIAEPGATIIIVVAEGILFKKPSITRDIIREETYIEGIISLPVHTYKPYTAVKTSLLVLRKKKVGESAPENLFLGNPQSLDEIEEVGNAFVEWKKGVLSK